MTENVPGVGEKLAIIPKNGFDAWDPGNISPMVAYLATDQCRFTGETFHVVGGQITRLTSWTSAEEISKDERWTVEELIAAGPSLAGKGIVKPAQPPFPEND